MRTKKLKIKECRHRIYVDISFLMCKNINEALMAGMKAYDEYINGGSTKYSQMSYSDYLDYWMKEYFEMSWLHYLELLKVDEESKRNFYIKEAINSRWSVRELQRQIGSLIYITRG